MRGTLIPRLLPPAGEGADTVRSPTQQTLAQPLARLDAEPVAISIDLGGAGWRIGHVDGPPAGEVQLRAALGDVAGIEVGARCAGWVEGPTVYPCGFSVRQLDFAGAVQDRYTGIAIDWATPQAAVEARPRADLGGLISPVLDAPRFVGLRAPLRYLGDKSKTLRRQVAVRDPRRLEPAGAVGVRSQRWRGDAAQRTPHAAHLTATQGDRHARRPAGRRRFS